MADPTRSEETDELDKRQAVQKLVRIFELVESGNYNSFEDILQTMNLSQEQYNNVHSIITKRKCMIYQRNVDALWINPYNKTLLLAWNANMDIQPVLDVYSCVMYIVSYISKAERQMGDLLRNIQSEARQNHMEPMQELRQLGNVFIQNRDISVMEAVFRVTGMKLKYATRETVYLPSDKDSARCVLLF